MRELKFKLTPAGYCCNPACGRQLYLELMRAPDDEACYECNPLPEGARAPMVLLQGGRNAQTVELATASPRATHGHCTEACCSSSGNQWLHKLPLITDRVIADRVACVTCGDAQPASLMLKIRGRYKCRACVNLCAMDCTNPFCPGCLPF